MPAMIFKFMDKRARDAWIFLVLFGIGCAVFKISGDYALNLTESRQAYGLDNPARIGWDLWIAWRLNWMGLFLGVVGLFGILIKTSIIHRNTDQYSQE